MYGEGISYEGDLLDLATKYDMVEKSGAWYSYQGTRIGQGKENARDYLKQNPDVAAALDKSLREMLLEPRARARNAEDEPQAEQRT
jgi:recombination protein RecA